MVPFVRGDPARDFWKQNPEIKELSPFNKLFNKKNGSKAMWCVYKLCDPKSPIYRYGPEEKREEVQDTYAKGDVDVSKLTEYVAAYPSKCLTERERFYVKGGDMLREFDKHFDSLSFSRNLKDKMDMLDKRDKLWKSYLDAEKSAKDEFKYRTKGDRLESALETGEIG